MMSRSKLYVGVAAAFAFGGGGLLECPRAQFADSQRTRCFRLSGFGAVAGVSCFFTELEVRPRMLFYCEWLMIT